MGTKLDRKQLKPGQEIIQLSKLEYMHRREKEGLVQFSLRINTS